MPARPSAPVTMKTLADHVGVSVATVSNAYSRPDQLSQALRDQILTAAEELGYTGPNAAGRALRSGRSDVCGFLFGGELSQAFSDPYSVVFLAGVSESLEEFGASVLLLKRPTGDGLSQVLRRAPIDALIASSTVSDRKDFDLLRRRGVRIVETHPSEHGDWVGVDDVAAARLVADHLVRLGHRRVTILASGAATGTVEEGAYRPGRPVPGMGEASYEARRIRGLWDGLGADEVRVVRADDNTRQAGRRAAAHAMDVQDRPTALVAVSDVMAFGAIDAARVRGIVPGRDVSICGFDDLPDADFLGLTSLRQPVAEKGRLAGRLAMDPDYPRRQISLPVELVVRSSTGPAPKG